MSYLSDSARPRTRTRNLFRHKSVSIPLGIQARFLEVNLNDRSSNVRKGFLEIETVKEVKIHCLAGMPGTGVIFILGSIRVIIYWGLKKSTNESRVL